MPTSQPLTSDLERHSVAPLKPQWRQVWQRRKRRILGSHRGCRYILNSSRKKPQPQLALPTASETAAQYAVKLLVERARALAPGAEATPRPRQLPPLWPSGDSNVKAKQNHTRVSAEQLTAAQIL